MAAGLPEAPSDRAVYRRLLPLLRPYRRRLSGALAASAASPLLLAARIWLVKVLVDGLVHRRPAVVPAVAAAFVVLAVARGALTFWQESSSGVVGTAVVRDLRVQVYGELHARALRYFHTQRLGDLLTRLSGDIAAVEDLMVSGLTDLVGYVVTIAVFVALLAVLDPRLLLLAAAVLPALALTTYLGARLGRRAQQQIRDRTSELTSTAEEGLSAVALVKAFARGDHERDRFAEAAGRSASARLRAVAVRAVFPPLSDLVTALGMAVVVWVGARQALDGRLGLGSLVVFISYLASMYNPIQGLSRVTSSVQRALVGAARVVELLDAPAAARERTGNPALPAVRGHVQLRAVDFGYRPGQRVLHQVDLAVEPGELVALIGASGAGKTTVVSLLLGFYDPDGGEVLLDGHPLRNYDLGSVRRQVSAVLQEPMLFDASIRENIRYGRLDATEDEVGAAARAAQAEQFIAQLPEGYDTVVGPRGARLSGGQRQRLALARAMLKRAPVLILDEATSALDPMTEARVLRALRAGARESAVLVVAHRYSTVSHADRIVVLDAGRVVEQGTHASLVASGGAYCAFLRSQRGAEPAEQVQPATG